MTMPKFEPITKVIVLDEADREIVFNLQKPLYTADQLSEAYEAGKRDASEDLEQAAFEKWLYDKCPSGDVESVQRQWLKSYEYAEFAGKLEQAAQIEVMRDALEFMWRDVPMNDYAFEKCEKALAIQSDDSALKAIAERTGLTVSELIRRAVDEYINRNRMAKK